MLKQNLKRKRNKNQKEINFVRWLSLSKQSYYIPPIIKVQRAFLNMNL